MRQLDGREDFQANKDVRKIWKVVRSSSWLRETRSSWNLWGWVCDEAWLSSARERGRRDDLTPASDLDPEDPGSPPPQQVP